MASRVWRWLPGAGLLFGLLGVVALWLPQAQAAGGMLSVTLIEFPVGWAILGFYFTPLLIIVALDLFRGQVNLTRYVFALALLGFVPLCLFGLIVGAVPQLTLAGPGNAHIDLVSVGEGGILLWVSVVGDLLVGFLAILVAHWQKRIGAQSMDNSEGGTRSSRGERSLRSTSAGNEYL